MGNDELNDIIDKLKINHNKNKRYFESYDDIFIHEEYKKLSVLAKTLYNYLSRQINTSIWIISNKIINGGFEMLDSEPEITKRYFDEKGEVFCIATNRSLREYFNVTDKTITKAKDDLIKKGLLEEKRTFNNTNLYYVKSLEKEKAPSIFDIESAINKLT